jgi:hypothetical protein
MLVHFLLYSSLIADNSVRIHSSLATRFLLATACSTATEAHSDQVAKFHQGVAIRPACYFRPRGFLSKIEFRGATLTPDFLHLKSKQFSNVYTRSAAHGPILRFIGLLKAF